MRLTHYTDFAMRVLIYLGKRPNDLFLSAEIARACGVSHNHLTKVVADLSRAGYLQSVRGRNGGIRLGRSPSEITVGAVVRHTEGDFDLVGCGTCIIAPGCSLTGVLEEGLLAFMSVLDQYTLTDLLDRKATFSPCLLKTHPAPKSQNQPL